MPRTRSATCSAIRRSRPRRPRNRRRGRLRHRCRPSAAGPAASRSGSCARRRAPGGPSTSPGAASRSTSAGRSSNLLKALAALLVPSRAHASTASAAASSSSSRRWRSSGSNFERTWSRPWRTGSPIPIRSRLNFSVPSSSITEPRPLWPPAPPPSRKRSLPNGSAKSSATTRRSTERRVLAGEHLPDGLARIVHVGQRLDERQVEAAEPAHDHVRRSRAADHDRSSRPAPRARPRPASRCCGASRRTGEPGFPRPTTTFNPNLRGQHDRARSRPTRSAGGPRRDGNGVGQSLLTITVPRMSWAWNVHT